LPIEEYTQQHRSNEGRGYLRGKSPPLHGRQVITIVAHVLVSVEDLRIPANFTVILEVDTERQEKKARTEFWAERVSANGRADKRRELANYAAVAAVLFGIAQCGGCGMAHLIVADKR
jgi:hypothetical protein